MTNHDELCERAKEFVMMAQSEQGMSDPDGCALAIARQLSGSCEGMTAHALETEQQPLYCPKCRCDVHNYMNYVGTTTCTATSGRGSRQERESYHKLYGELLYEVPHYTEGKISFV